TKMNGSLMLFFGLNILVALTALPSTPLGFTRAVNAWFDKNKGLALGISLTSTGIAATLLPKLLTPYVEEHGWRAGYFTLFLIVIIAIPFIWLLIKEQPSDDDQNDQQKAASNLTGLQLQEVLKTMTFWKLAAIFFLVSTAVLGLIPSFIPLLQDAQLNADKVGSLAAILGLSVMIGRLVTGFLIDRFFSPRVVTGIFTFVALGCLALGLGGIQFALLGAIALGLAVGAEVDLIGYFTAKYFGMKHYGSIYGVMYSIFSLGAIISPALAGLIWDKTGNYDLALVLAAVLVGIAVIFSLLLPRFSDNLR
ncbi:MAG: MFS transporter, partial [Bacteroidota bacterium]